MLYEMMQNLMLAVVFLIAGCQVVSSQFVPAPRDLKTKKGYADVSVRYKKVPAGICEMDPNVKSYSGYADISEREHIFWWFFETRNGNPKTAPLTVWINGGPGATSMVGLFQEIGPCTIGPYGPPVNNPYSWSNASNMIFIDQPVGTGFSYTEAIPAYIDYDEFAVKKITNGSCPSSPSAACGTWSDPDYAGTPNSTASAAPTFWKTLQGFMGAFPEYSRGGVNFGSESYGGHYAPIFSQYIEQQNAAIDAGTRKGHKIELTSVLIGNGWFDPLIHCAAHYNFSVSPGNTYDLVPYNDSVAAQVFDAMYGAGNCSDQIIACNTGGNATVCRDSERFCTDNVEYPSQQYTNRDLNDIRELSPDPFPPTYFLDYLNSQEVQEAIGAFTNCSFISPTVSNAFDSTGDMHREIGTVEAMRGLVAKNLTVVMYYGDADLDCNWIGGLEVAAKIDAPGFAKAGFTNISTSDGVVHGQVKQSGAFSFVRVYEAGHEVPFYQPLASLEMFERIINGKDIATGRKKIRPGSSYTTKGTAQSTYREGNGTTQYSVLPPDATYNTTTNRPNPVDATTDTLFRREAKNFYRPLSGRPKKMANPGLKLQRAD